MLEINASIVAHKQRFWCTYRTEHLFNYDAGTVLTELDANFTPITECKLKAGNDNTAFEDVRLFSTGDQLLAFYTYLPKIEDGGWSWKFGVGVGKIDLQSGKIIDQISLRHLGRREHEKNWCPYIVDNEIFLLTDYEPLIRIVKLGKIDADWTPEEFYLAKKFTVGWNYGEIRGGTPLLPNPSSDDGWRYGFVHSYLVSYNKFARYYFFTAVRFNHYTKELEYHPHPLKCDYESTHEHYDELWKYSNNRILKVIFPVGIMPYEDGVLVSFGVDDVTSVTNHFTWKYLEALFSNK